jgi:hypothetical protein
MAVKKSEAWNDSSTNNWKNSILKKQYKKGIILDFQVVKLKILKF